MGSQIGLLESRIEQFDRRAGEKHIPSLHKLLPLDIGEACLAISNNVLVDVPTTEDVVAAREDSCNLIHWANSRSVQRIFAVTTSENCSRTQAYASSFSMCKKAKLTLNVA
ncbi:unnamed protein product [Sphagnum jensenii]|uniref:Uncharacterized protein n=1 Tax=Sphagnum jensenii TaxID=128206 RepID=A0ABP0X6T3_9BRYO